MNSLRNNAVHYHGLPCFRSVLNPLHKDQNPTLCNQRKQSRNMRIWLLSFLTGRRCAPPNQSINQILNARGWEKKRTGLARDMSGLVSLAAYQIFHEKDSNPTPRDGRDEYRVFKAKHITGRHWRWCLRRGWFLHRKTREKIDSKISAHTRR